MSFSFSQALISETCPLTQPMGSDVHSQVTHQPPNHNMFQATYCRLSLCLRSMREKASCHRSSSARTCLTQPARPSADPLVRTSADLDFPDKVLFLDGPPLIYSRSLSACSTIHRKWVGLWPTREELCQGHLMRIKSRSVFWQTPRS